jgi:hypothetical protein
MEKSTKFRKEGSVSLLASPSRCQKILFLVDLVISGGNQPDATAAPMNLLLSF